MTRCDLRGRRYLEVLPFTDGPVKRALAAQPDPDHRCLECGRRLVHGSDRYFQRTKPSERIALPFMERALRALAYDPVCGPCGDRALAMMATN